MAKALHNTKNRKELIEERLREEKPMYTLSFYAYAHIGNPQVFRDHLYSAWEPLEVLGRVHVAQEGINAQIAYPIESKEAWEATMKNISFLKDIRHNYAVEEKNLSFYKLTIKVRNKILADGLNDDTFDVTNKGKHLEAVEFNEKLQDKNTIVIDMRNHYEHEVGHFENAVTPDVDNFRDSLPFIEETILQSNQDKEVLLYCTGGIRCEKASAWFKHKGYNNVYQLEGGIIHYTHEAKAQNLDNKFKGKNFVFDHRLGERISEDILSTCHQCGSPCDDHTNCANVGCNLLFIQCPSCAQDYNACCSNTCMEVITWPNEKQSMWRKKRKEAEVKSGGRNVFRKGRFPNNQEHV